MKRLAFLLIILMLLTGCGNSVKEYDLSSKYGITIHLPGSFSEEGGNTEDNFTFHTNLGRLEFRRYSDSEDPVNRENVEKFIQNNLNNSVEIQELDNGAYFFSLPPYGDSEDDQYKIVEAYYFIQSGENAWKIHCVAPNIQYKEADLLTALRSIVFAVQ